MTYPNGYSDRILVAIENDWRGIQDIKSRLAITRWTKPYESALQWLIATVQIEQRLYEWKRSYIIHYRKAQS